MRILLADDEAVIRMGLRAMLEDMGHLVVGTATDGKDAVWRARTVNPDLIILDIKMTGMDGIEAARQIMLQRPTPIVMLTAYSQRELIEQAKAAWVFAYLVKPVREDVLGPTLELAAVRFKEWQTLQAEVKDLQKSLEVRELVERAKHMLMKSEQLTERQAYDKIHHASRTRRVSMQQVAEEILKRIPASKHD